MKVQKVHPDPHINVNFCNIFGFIVQLAYSYSVAVIIVLTLYTLYCVSPLSGYLHEGSSKLILFRV